MAVAIKEQIKNHRFFSHMEAEHIVAITQCAEIKSYLPQEMLGSEGEFSDYFFALIHGRVAIESDQPGFDRVVLQTLHGGEVVGWSWLFPPYEWVFDARAITPVTTLAFDGKCLREKCESDKVLGYELMKRLAHVMTLRLKATRLQLLDIYGREKFDKDDDKDKMCD